MTHAHPSPSLCRAAKKSPYRQRLAAVAKPLEERVQKLIEIGETIFRGTPRPRSILMDLVAFEEALDRVEEITTAHNIPIPPAGSCRNGGEVWRRLFYEQGVFFDLSDSKLCTGPLLAEHQIDGLDAFFAALTRPIGSASNYLSERKPIETPARVIMDVASFLEEAVYRINLFRYRQMEPLASLLFTTEEKEQSLRTPLFKQRLKRIAPAGKLKRIDFERILRDLSQDTGDDPVDQAFASILVMRFMDRIVRSTGAEDEIEHTLNLCNLIVRSALVSQLAAHREFERLKEEHGADNEAEAESFHMAHQPQLDYVGWMADIAYGNPIYRIGSASQSGIVYPDDSESLRFFEQHGTTPILQRTGLRSDDLMGAFYDTLTCPAERFQAAARELLDEVFTSWTGKSFSETFPGLVQAFEQINGTTFVTREQLPIIAEVWKSENVDPADQR